MLLSLAALLLGSMPAHVVHDVRVLVFLRSDCPVSNLYAPEIQRLAGEFRGRVEFQLVFPDSSDVQANVDKDVAEYYAQSWLQSRVLRDPKHELVRQTGVTMMPEAAVLDGDRVVYAGRIDDRVVGLGKFRAEAQVHDLENAVRAVLDGKPVQAAGGPAYGCYIADAQ